MAQDTPAAAYLWLDVNASGAWKHVLRFQAVNAPEVRDLAAAMAAMATSTGAFRLATEDNQAVAYCTYMAVTQRYEWRSA